MPLKDHMHLISTDDHIVEPPHLWVDRLPVKYADEMPHVVTVEGSVTNVLGMTSEAKCEMWLYEGQPFPNIVLNATAGRPVEEYSLAPIAFGEMRPGCYDPAERVADMDLDGVQAGLGFPTFPGFAGKTFLAAKDKELALLCAQAYNDFLLDEWCAPHPGRFIACVILPLWDPQLAARELERCLAKGAHAVSFLENPAGLDLPSFHSDHWDPVLALASEAGAPLCLHFGTSTKMPFVSPDAPFTVTIALMGTNSMATLAELLFSRTFRRFPDLKVALSEGGIGWIPWALDRLDYTWERHRYYTGIDTEMRPSELYRDRIFGCFIDDEAGIDLRHRIGIDQITWECDYPHSDSPWPKSRTRVSEMLATVPDDDAHKIVELNARRLFAFPRLDDGGDR